MGALAFRFRCGLVIIGLALAWRDKPSAPMRATHGRTDSEYWSILIIQPSARPTNWWFVEGC